MKSGGAKPSHEYQMGVLSLKQKKEQLSSLVVSYESLFSLKQKKWTIVIVSRNFLCLNFLNQADFFRLRRYESFK